MGDAIQLSCENRGPAVLVRVDETQILADRAESFRVRLLACVPAPGARVALDMSRVDFLDSSGLGALVSLLKAVRPEGELVLFAVRPSVREILRLTHLDSVFPCEDDESAALSHMGASAPGTR
jgi:anti-sigma B factor antagonist